MTATAMRRTTPGTRPLIRTLAVLTLGLLAGCATLPPGARPDPRDPMERFNRTMFKFDDSLVEDVGRPVGKAWTTVTPNFLRRAIANVFSNAHMPDVMINDALQGKFRAAGTDFARFAINTTFGIGGLLDAASFGGVARNDNDFGRTLGTWGVPSGPYLVLPFFGPSTVRDAVARVPDTYASPVTYINNTEALWGTEALGVLNDLTESILPTYDLLDSQHPFDRYGFARNAYLQRRDFLIHGPREQNLDQEELELQKSLQDDSDGAAPQQ